ncbi:alpha/beta hydrolase [Macrococcoides caseolyticum]|uniref:alpha/beta hydrolase n=1 Tax=Macrococcoides caseolyticum TaxID=69966 RepID=UPI001EEAFCD0|nr:alpha/beta hydrolase-fold protein [Macrococcus caseolyticus]MCE4955714.1 esterase family protein [Macrococcus caseolyticus]
MKSGLITPYTITSHYLNRDVKIGIYLKADYSPFVDYNVVICFDGQDVSQIGQIHRQYERLDMLEETLFVFVHYTNGGERRKEYHPEGALRQAYQQFVVYELKMMLEETLNLQLNNTNTILLGDSLAASIALTITLEYPNFATRAVLFSPMITTHLVDTIDALNQQLSEQLDYYLVVGSEEHSFKLQTGETADFLTPIRAFHQTLLTHHIRHYYAELDGGHTWKTWKPHIENSLNYYLS